ncbi:MAG: hypothetical protein RRB22_01560 [Gammaproteobacteria bacterium]|nr:hypothetical protein [Gammaproteobacteria bacterium]
MAKAPAISTTAPIALPTPPTPVTIDPTSLAALVSTFETAYQAGDVDTLASLFAPTVRTNEQVNLAGLRGEYQDLFRSTTERKIQFKNLKWEREKSYARATGEYEASKRREAADSLYQEQGKVILQLERRADKLQITRFYSSDVTPVTTATASAQVTTTQVTPAAKSLPTAELEKLIKTLIATYNAGDITSFMKLFAKDAQTNDRATLQGIRDDYVSLFNNTTSRKIALSQLNWKWDGGIARGEARYDVDIQPSGQDKKDHYQGLLWLQVERRDNNMRITHFAFSE